MDEETTSTPLISGETHAQLSRNSVAEFSSMILVRATLLLVTSTK